MTSTDPRRQVPRTDAVLADPRLRAATERLSLALVKDAVNSAQRRARAGEIAAEDVAAEAADALPPLATSMFPLLNATGVVLHTNIGRAPLSPAAVAAVVAASGYVDVEFDVATGSRARRGRGMLDALRTAVPDADDVLVVNNGAAALVLATTVLATGREVIVSRGELVEIGDGFRLPDLVASTGTRLREVGTTNRSHLRDYAEAIGPDTGCILKVHPSNFQVEGFTSSVEVAELSTLGVPVVVDIGSGLLVADPCLPGEPDARTALLAGATVVTCSGDKLLGGPQAGLVLGRRDIVERLRSHPLARAVRVDKLTIAALEATLRGPKPPVWQSIHVDQEALRRRTERLARQTGGDLVRCIGAVGGGGAPGLAMPGWAVALPPSLAERLRCGIPSVIGRIDHDRLLIDLRCIPAADDERLRDAVLACTS